MNLCHQKQEIVHQIAAILHIIFIHEFIRSNSIELIDARGKMADEYTDAVSRLPISDFGAKINQVDTNRSSANKSSKSP